MLFKRFKLRKLLQLIACFLLISSCTSVILLEQPVVDHWNSVQTQKHLLAKWFGVTPGGDQISYQFSRGETCIWTYSGKEIDCKFQATPHETGYRVLIYDMAGEQFKDVQFIAWVKIERNKMMFYGYPTKFGRKQSGERAQWPNMFPNDSILLTAQEL